MSYQTLCSAYTKARVESLCFFGPRAFKLVNQRRYILLQCGLRFPATEIWRQGHRESGTAGKKLKSYLQSGLALRLCGTKDFAKNVTRCFRRPRIPPTSLDTAPCTIEGGQAQVQAQPHVASQSAIFVNGLPRREARQCAPHHTCGPAAEVDTRTLKCARKRTRVPKNAHTARSMQART